MNGCYSLKGVLKCIGVSSINMSVTIICFAHLKILYASGMFFEDGFYLVLLFLLPGI